MMVALTIIADNFADATKYDIIIYQTEDYSKRRFQFQKDIHLLPNLNYIVIRYDENSNTFNEELFKAVHTISRTGFSRFVMFNHHSFLAIYLSRKLALKNTRIVLAPDGLKPYSNTRRMTPRWSLKTAIKFYKFIKGNRLSYFFHYPSLEYANLKEISLIYIHFPKAFLNFRNIVTKEVKVLESENSKHLVSRYFKFSTSNEEIFNNVIFFINQPLNNQDIYNFEIDLLEQIKLKFPHYKLVIKLHPLTDYDHVEKFKALNATIISETYPAELYIAQLKHSIVLSFWSTASLIDNPSCRFYWLYPMLQNRGIMLSYINIQNPTEHILEVSSIEQLQ
ncbi:hypothetical protein [Flavobacterium cyanobacteriorum]|nr:hypothetical protein [Flavobacterium cyanobacteriorum]